MCNIIASFTLTDNNSWTAVWAIANGRDAEAAIQRENEQAANVARLAANPMQGCALPPFVERPVNFHHPRTTTPRWGSSRTHLRYKPVYEWTYGQRGYRETYSW